MAMSQRSELTWVELRVGLFVLVGLGILATGILYVTGAGTLAPKYELRTYLPEAEGLTEGTDVTLDGLLVGSVKNITLSTSDDRSHNIEVVMRVDRRYQQHIRTDSVASLVTQGLLGSRYVSISRGYSGEVLAPGSTVQASEEIAIKDVVQRGADLVQNLGVLTQDVSGVVDKLKGGQGTLGKLLNDPTLYNNLNATADQARSLMASTRQGNGTLGKLMTSDELYKKADKAIDNAGAILADVHQQKGTIGKLVSDPTMYNEAKDFINHSNALVSDVRSGKGTLGKLATDDTLYTNMKQASVNIRDATAKLNTNTSTAGKFFNDPKLYDNLTGLTGDMRSLIADIRKDPKKFLHTTFSIF
jgi:phospholipid/cholesterol/gamma-HCH transport system substrate-binding protein